MPEESFYSKFFLKINSSSKLSMKNSFIDNSLRSFAISEVDNFLDWYYCFHMKLSSLKTCQNIVLEFDDLSDPVMSTIVAMLLGTNSGAVSHIHHGIL